MCKTKSFSVKWLRFENFKLKSTDDENYWIMMRMKVKALKLVEKLKAKPKESLTLAKSVRIINCFIWWMEFLISPYSIYLGENSAQKNELKFF